MNKIKVRMQDYSINVTEIEELQTVQNIDALNQIFARARRAVIGGAVVLLTRKHANGTCDKFDEITTETDLAQYKENVYKYLNQHHS